MNLPSRSDHASIFGLTARIMFLLCSKRGMQTEDAPVLIEKDLPRPTPITFGVRELIAELKSGPLVLIWYDPKRGPQTMPIGDARRVRPDTKVYQVPGEYEVAVLMATKLLLDKGDEAEPTPASPRWRARIPGDTRPCPEARERSTDAKSRFPVRVAMRPPGGIGRLYKPMTDWLDENCGIARRRQRCVGGLPQQPD
jgi:hypothetical protein